MSCSCKTKAPVTNTNDAVITVKGKVHDLTYTLPGAHIYALNDPSFGVITNMDGEFQIDARVGTKMVVSFLGYHDTYFVIREGYQEVIMQINEEALDTVYITNEPPAEPPQEQESSSIWGKVFLGAAAAAAVLVLFSGDDEEKKKTKKLNLQV
ncbi:carboxypeptidase-like regulatory domain-containing protein [Kordia sp.]|uniref:carboxypeptidase-like regulatory domain-containing protein n=1 Tax=Kordia sp. TaxID=1965332 RepID=UPI0025BD444D|nr:carboxypeptidase-like regulatory domain-containing protein [Kordia sp.]MCH2194392.1 carboxypeptidase-like regulatory domain-containing protein [Kordia sp.]